MYLIFNISRKQKIFNTYINISYLLCCRTETKIYKHSYHETTILKEKESGAEGRERRKQEAKEAEKLKKFFVPFFKRCSSVNTDDNPISKV